MPGIRELVEERGGETLELWAKSINPQFTRVLKTIGFDRTWVRAEGAYLWDSKDRRYLDMLGGFGMFNVGRNNPNVRAALVEALELDLPGGVQLGVSPLPPLLGAVLRAHAAASRARAVHEQRHRGPSGRPWNSDGRQPGGRASSQLEHAFHGLTLGSSRPAGTSRFTRAVFGPLLPGFARVPMGDLDALERELAAEDVAVFLVEPVQGKGVHLSPEGYLPAAQELCRRYGTLFGVDEVQTGFGRTGKLFAFEHWGLEPDLVTVAKSYQAGTSIGALVMSKTVHEAVFDSMEKRVQPRLDLRAQRARDGGRPGDLARSTSGLVDRAALGRVAGPRPSRSVSGMRSSATCGARAHVGVSSASHPGGPVRRWASGSSRPFSQLVPALRDHRVLIQVAGHGLQVIKGLPPLVVSEGDLEEFAAALDSTIAGASHVPRSMAGFALTAAGIR
jgi:ornithine--oxo-acid transaminase